MKKRDQGALLGLGLGLAYFAVSEARQDKTANCSYLAPWTTDAGAVLAAAVVYHRAREGDDFWLGAVAGAITAIHGAQFVHFKTKG